jgi:hypothetical protein
VHTVSLGFTA